MSAQLAIARAYAEAMKVLAAEQAELNFVHDELKNMRVKLAELDVKKTSRRRGRALSTSNSNMSGMLCQACQELDTTGLADLSDEVLWLLFSRVDLRDVASLAAVSHRFADVLQSSAESVWRAHACIRLGLDEDQVGAPFDTCGGTLPSETTWRKVLQAHWAPPPTSLTSNSKEHELTTNGLTARFTGRLGGDRAVRTDAPLPLCAPFVAVRACAAPSGSAPSSSARTLPPPVVSQVVLSDTVYFEVSVKDAPPNEGAPSEPSHADPCVSVGLSTAAFKLSGKQCGWDRHSLGFHGDDGFLYESTGVSHHRYGPRFGANDVVGCGLHLPTMQCFFTVNGRFLGPAFGVQPRSPHASAHHGASSVQPRASRTLASWPAAIPQGPVMDQAALTLLGDAYGQVYLHDLFPTIGIDSHQMVQINFGREQPFLVDLERTSRSLSSKGRVLGLTIALLITEASLSSSMPMIAAQPAAQPAGATEQVVEYEDDEDDEDGEDEGEGESGESYESGWGSGESVDEDDGEEEEGGGEDEDEEDGTAPMGAVPSPLATFVSAPPL